MNYNTAVDQYISINDVRFAYRRFGKPSKRPLVCIQHFRGTMDHWNPDLLNALCDKREVVIMDNSGIGRSEGEVPLSFKECAETCLSIIRALGIDSLDLLGFSIGGFMVQMMTLLAPGMVKHLILAGTGPSAGEGVRNGPREKLKQLAFAKHDSEDESRNAFIDTFYRNSEHGREVGLRDWNSMSSARQSRTFHLPVDGAKRQLQCMNKWGDRKYAAEGSYDYLHTITCPVLIANGDEDDLIPTSNSLLLYNLIQSPKSLMIFPNSGHGFLNQYAKEFASSINTFLDGAKL